MTGYMNDPFDESMENCIWYEEHGRLHVTVLPGSQVSQNEEFLFRTAFNTSAALNLTSRLCKRRCGDSAPTSRFIVHHVFGLFILLHTNCSIPPTAAGLLSPSPPVRAGGARDVSPLQIRHLRRQLCHPQFPPMSRLLLQHRTHQSQPNPLTTIQLNLAHTLFHLRLPPLSPLTINHPKVASVSRLLSTLLQPNVPKSPTTILPTTPRSLRPSLLPHRSTTFLPLQPNANQPLSHLKSPGNLRRPPTILTSAIPSEVSSIVTRPADHSPVQQTIHSPTHAPRLQSTTTSRLLPLPVQLERLYSHRAPQNYTLNL